MSRIFLFSMLLVSCLGTLEAAGTAYRCQGEWGEVVFADRPCGSSPEAFELRQAPALDPWDRRSLEKAEEARRRRDAALRQRQEQARRAMAERRAAREQENRLRREAARGNVLPGMTAGQVTHAWGRPDRVSRNANPDQDRERWWYRQSGRGREGRATVRFRDGRVVSLRRQTGQSRY